MATRLQRIPQPFQKQIERDLHSLAKKIKKSRQKLGLTQEKLSEKLDIGVETLQCIENSTRYPSLPMLYYICKKMGIKITIS